MVDSTNFLDLYDVFVNELVGSTMLFVIVGVIIIFYVAAVYRMPFQAVGMLVALFLMVYIANTLDWFLYVLVLIVAGLLFYLMVARLIRRG